MGQGSGIFPWQGEAVLLLLNEKWWCPFTPPAAFFFPWLSANSVCVSPPPWSLQCLFALESLLSFIFQLWTKNIFSFTYNHTWIGRDTSLANKYISLGRDSELDDLPSNLILFSDFKSSSNYNRLCIRTPYLCISFFSDFFMHNFLNICISCFLSSSWSFSSPHVYKHKWISYTLFDFFIELEYLTQINNLMDINSFIS